MKLARDLAVIGITAILSAPFSRPRAAHADGDQRPAASPAAAIDLHGVALTLVQPANNGSAREAVATLTVVNRNGGPVERNVLVRLDVSPPVDPRARMLMPPTERWSRKIVLKLAAGETKTLEVRTGVRVGAREIATFRIGPKRETALARALVKKTT